MTKSPLIRNQRETSQCDPFWRQQPFTEKREGDTEEDESNRPVMAQVAAEWRLSSLVVLKSGKHPGETKVRTNLSNNLYRTNRNLWEGP